jgi:hypothetical protein
MCLLPSSSESILIYYWFEIGPSNTLSPCRIIHEHTDATPFYDTSLGEPDRHTQQHYSDFTISVRVSNMDVMRHKLHVCCIYYYSGTWSQKYVSSAVTYNHITICLVVSTTAGCVRICNADWGYPCFSSVPPDNLPYSTLYYGSRDSSVIIVSGYRLDDGAILVLSPADA